MHSLNLGNERQCKLFASGLRSYAIVINNGERILRTKLLLLILLLLLLLLLSSSLLLLLILGPFIGCDYNGAEKAS